MKKLTTLTGAMVCALLLSPLVSSAQVTVTTAEGHGADAGLSNDGQNAGTGPDVAHGTEAGTTVRRVLPDVRLWMTVLRFQKPTNLVNYSDSTLSFNIGFVTSSGQADVYGLLDGAPGQLYDEAAITFNTAPGITNTGLGTWGNDGNLVLLGTIPGINTGTEGLRTTTPAEVNLAEFLRQDTDGIVNLYVIHQNGWFGFDTKETASGIPASLYLPNAVTDPGLSNLTWAVASGNWDINNTPNWNNGVSASVYTEVTGIGNRVRLDDTASGASPITITLDTTVVPFSLTNDSAKNYTLAGTGSLSGGTGITKNGSGTLTLNTYNLFTGPVTLKAGTLVLGSNSSGQALGSLASQLNLNGGSLVWGPGSTEDISQHPVHINSEVTLDTGANTVFLGSGIGNGGNGGIIKTGTGKLTLAADNAFYGNTTVQQGTLTISGGDALTNSPAIVVNAGATLEGFGFLNLNPENNQILAGSGKLSQASVYAPTNTVITPGTNGVVGTLSLGTPAFGDGNLTLEGGKLVLDVSTAGPNDLLDVNGGLTFAGGTVQLNINGTLANGTYKVIECDYVNGLGSVVVTGFSQPGQVAFLSDATAGQLELVVVPLSNLNLVWSGTGINWDVDGAAAWLNGASPSVFHQGDSVTFDDTGLGSPNVNLASLVFPSAITVNSSGDFFIDSFTGGRVSGSSALTKSGSGTLTVNTLNGNSGGTTINGGTLVVGGHLGSGPVANNSAVVFAQTTDRTVSALSGTGSLTQQGSAVLTVTSDTHTGPTTITSGTLQFGNGGASSGPVTPTIANSGILAINTSSDLTLTNGVMGTGGLTKAGTGTLSLSANVAHTGQTRVDAGKLLLTAQNQIPGSVRIENGGTLDINGFDQIFTSLVGSAFSGRLVNNGGTATNVVTLTNAATADSAVVIANNDGTGGAIAFVKDGAGEFIWRANGTYTGGTTINAGRINMRESGVMGTGPVTLKNAASIAIRDGRTLANPLTVPAEGTIVALGNITMNGPIIGSSSSVLRFLNGGGTTTTLGGGSDFTTFPGRVIVGDGTNNVNFRFNGGTGSATTIWDLNTNGNNVNTRNGNATIRFGQLLGGALSSLNGASSINAGTTYEIGALNLDADYLGTIQDGANSDRFAAITKVGTGRLTLSGSLLYTGPTVVSNGVLAISGTGFADSRAITVVAPGVLDLTGMGGTLMLGSTRAQSLGGNGTLTGDVTVSANPVTIAPGSPVGALTVSGNLTLGANVSVAMQLDKSSAPTSDRILASSIAVNGAVLTVTNVGSKLSVGESFRLFSTATPGFGSVTLPAEDQYASYTWNDKLAVDGTIEVATVVSKLDTTPTHIVVTVGPGNITLGWPASHTGWTLQAQTNALSVGLSNGWVNLGYEGTNSATLPIDPLNPTVFYRLTLP